MIDEILQCTAYFNAVFDVFDTINIRYAEISEAKEYVRNETFFERQDAIDFAINKIQENTYSKLWVVVNPLKPEGGKAKDSSIAFARWFVVDIDTKEVDKQKLALMTAEELYKCKASVVVQSGNGLHLYFRCDSPNTIEHTKQRRDATRKLDSLVPGCIDRKCYNVSRALRIPGSYNRKCKPLFICRMIPQAYGGLLDFSAIDLTPELPSLPIDSAKEGNRNNALYSSALIASSSAKVAGFDLESVKEKLLKKANKAGIPESEANATINSAFKLSEVEQGLPDLGIGDESSVAKAVCQVIKPVIGYKGNLYRYLCGAWSKFDESQFSTLVQSWSGVPCGHGEKPQPLRISANLVKGAYSLAVSQVQNETFFDEDSGKVVFINGTYIFGEGLVPHSPEHRAQHSLPFEYTETRKKAKLFEYLIKSSLGPEFIELFYQIVAISLLGFAPRYRKAALLLGRKGTGKSQLVEILKATVPKTAVVCIPPSDFAKKFSLHRIVDAKLNAVFEVDEREIIRDGNIKAVISCEDVAVEEKFKKPETAKPKCFHIFCANTLPPTANASDAIFDRFVVIPFSKKSFRGSALEIKDLGKLIIDEELQWLTLNAIDTLEKNEKLNIPAICEAERRFWQVSCDSVLQWLETKPARSSILLDFNTYLDFAKATGIRYPVGFREFKRRISNEEFEQ